MGSCFLIIQCMLDFNLINDTKGLANSKRNFFSFRAVFK